MSTDIAIAVSLAILSFAIPRGVALFWGELRNPVFRGLERATSVIVSAFAVISWCAGIVYLAAKYF